MVLPMGPDQYEVYSLPRGETKVVTFHCTHGQLEQFLKGWMDGMRAYDEGKEK
jgi:hypothetical protein